MSFKPSSCKFPQIPDFRGAGDVVVGVAVAVMFLRCATARPPQLAPSLGVNSNICQSNPPFLHRLNLPMHMIYEYIPGADSRDSPNLGSNARYLGIVAEPLVAIASGGSARVLLRYVSPYATVPWRCFATPQ